METKKWYNEIVITPIEDRGTTDYLYLLQKGVSPDQRKQYNCGDIFINGAVCLHCKEFIRSMNKHNFRSCSCGKVVVDGGSRYCKRLGRQEDYINVIEMFSNINEE